MSFSRMATHKDFVEHKNEALTERSGFAEDDSEGLPKHLDGAVNIPLSEITGNNNKVEISEKQFAKLEFGIKKIFEGFFNENDGIEGEKLYELLHSMGYRISDEDFNGLLSFIDKDRNESIDLLEFLNFLTSCILPSDDSVDNTLKAFGVFDPYDTGFISAMELRTQLFNLGDEFSNDEMNQFIKKADYNSDGQVNYVEFVRLMFLGTDKYVMKNPVIGKTSDRQEVNTSRKEQ